MNAETSAHSSNNPPTRSGFSGKQVMLFIFLAILVTAGITYWFIRSYVYASDFRPVELSEKEQVTLDDKLRAVGVDPQDFLPGTNRSGQSIGSAVQRDADGNLIPEKYSCLLYTSPSPRDS